MAYWYSLRSEGALLLGLLLCAWAVAAEQVSSFKSVSVILMMKKRLQFQ